MNIKNAIEKFFGCAQTKDAKQAFVYGSVQPVVNVGFKHKWLKGTFGPVTSIGFYPFFTVPQGVKMALEAGVFDDGDGNNFKIYHVGVENRDGDHIAIADFTAGNHVELKPLSNCFETWVTEGEKFYVYISEKTNNATGQFLLKVRECPN